MVESKMYKVPIIVERKYVTEDSEVRIYLSQMRSEKKPPKKKIKDKIVALVLELFYTGTITYLVGDWAIGFAYKERGYFAYGSEYLLIVLTFLISFRTIRAFFKVCMRI